MTPTAITIAAIITWTCFAIPTAVMTESSEKTMSRIAIWVITPPKEPRPRRCGTAASRRPFELVVDLVHALGQQEEPADEEDQVAAGELAPEQGEERAGQPHDPGDGEQQQDPRHHGQAEAEDARPALAGAAGAFRPGSR